VFQLSAQKVKGQGCVGKAMLGGRPRNMSALVRHIFQVIIIIISSNKRNKSFAGDNLL